MKGGFAMNLSGKVALVTGSGRNIGKATLLELARHGCDVTVNAARNQQEVEAVARQAVQLGVRAMPVIADVGNEEDVNKMVDLVLSRFGRIDILINNAGLRPRRRLTEITTEEWRRVLSVNLEGPFYLSRAVVPSMVSNGGGRIINVGGLNAFRGKPEWAHVCSSKMGAVGLTRALALELAPYRILVNHIVPGYIDTIRDTSEDPLPDKAAIPLGRFGMVEEIARTCAFLASDDAGFITGQVIHVNGGALMI